MAWWLTLLRCHSIQKNRNYYYLLIHLSALVDTTHIKVNQKDHVFVVYFHHHCIMVHIPLYAGLTTSTLPAAHLTIASLSLLMEASTHFHRIQTI